MIGLLSHLVDVTIPVKWEENQARPQREVDLCSKDALVKAYRVTISERPDDVNTGLRDTGVYDARE